MTLTPEQLAKSREEFESVIGKEYSTLKNSDKESPYYYDDYHVDLMFQSWIARQESLVVDLPRPRNAEKMLILDYVLKLKKSLQSAGINYREKE